MKPISAARRKMRKVNAHQCPAYFGPKSTSPLGQGFEGPAQGIQSLEYLDYARDLVGLPPDETDQSIWSPSGWCERPKFEFFVSVCSEVYALH
jgi:mannosidase alpha-like ER degradation enhancer 1